MNQIITGISIIIPSHSREIELELCIKSIIENKYKKPYEIIIIDDGKTYNKKEFLKKNKSNKIKLFNQIHSGPATARNLGVKKAKYNIISFLDDDCTVPKNWLSTIHDFFINNKYKNIAAVRGKTETETKQKYMKAHLLYENYWLYMIHKDFNGKKTFIQRLKFVFRKHKSKQFIVDFAPTNNLSILRNKKIPKFNQDFKEAAGEDVVFCNMVKAHNMLIAYNDSIIIYHNHQFSSKKEFKDKFKSYGRNLSLDRSFIKKIFNIFTNPLLISIYHRNFKYIFQIFLIEYYINFF